VNDAPALKIADVGFSMGSGCDIAKDASDIVITDDSFSSITKAILYGRTIFESIRKFIVFQLTVNFCAMGVSVIGPFIGIEKPITVVQMLWVNIIMDTCAAAALASLPPNKSVMNEPPRKNSDFIITRPMALNIALYAALFVAVQVAMLFVFYKDGALTTTEMSVFFTTFVMLQFWNMFNAKAFMTGSSALKGLLRSPSFVVVALLLLLGQYLIVTFCGTMFSVTPLSLPVWGRIILATSLVLLLPELFCHFKRMFRVWKG
jgi:Ca2+-transporting ATPase